MKTRKPIIYHSGIKNFIFLLLLFCSIQIGYSQTHTIHISDDITTNCETINFGIQVLDWGEAPYTIAYKVNGSVELKDIPHNNIIATFLHELPSSAGISTFNYDIIDANLEVISEQYSIDVKTGFCKENIIRGIEIEYKNAIEEQIGENCKIYGSIDMWFPWGGDHFMDLFTIRNESGQILYRHENHYMQLYFNTFSSLPHTDYIQNKVTDKIYLEFRKGNAIWTEKVEMFLNEINVIFDDEVGCYLPDQDDSPFITPDVLPGEIPISIFSPPTECINPDNSPYERPTYGATYTRSVELTKSVGLEIIPPAIRNLVSIAFSGEWSWTNGESISNSVSWKLEEDLYCEMCIENLAPEKPDCNIRKDDADAVKPIMRIFPREQIVEVKFMDCDGEIQSGTIKRKTYDAKRGYKCTNATFSCPIPCDDKELEPQFEFPDESKGNSGFIAAGMTNGVAPFEYSWSVNKSVKGSGGESRSGLFEELPESGNIITGLEAGEYCVTVTDAECCEVEECMEIPCVFNMEVSVENTFCGSSLHTGSIVLENVNGVEPITYEWNVPGFGPSLYYLQAGTYTIKATDADGCIFMKSIPVSEISETTVSAGIHPSRWCSDDGAIDLNIQAAGNDYTVEWDNGVTSTSQSGLSAGTYCVTVTDEGECETVKCFTVGVRAPMNVVVNTVGTCGGDYGEAHLEVSGGEAPYTYQWLGLSGSGPSVTGVAPGNYAVIITDNSGCQRVKGVNINESPSMRIYSESEIPCSGEGMNASVTPDGGTPPYSYLWSNGSQLSNIYNVDPDFYTVVVTDAAGCSNEVEFDLSYTGEIVLNFEVTPNIDGCANDVGSILMQPTGGKHPYVYKIIPVGSINGPLQSSPLFENLSAGDYYLACKDACGNQSTIDPIPIATVELIENPNQYTINLEPTHTCHTWGTGSIDLQIDGDCNNCSYLWSNGQTTQDLNNVAPNEYTVTVTDNQGCEKIETTTVELKEDDLYFDFDWTDSCEDLDNGSASVNDGNDDNTVIWSTGETSHNIYGLSPGIYSVTVTSPTGCSESITFQLDNEPTLNFETELLQNFTQNQAGVFPARIKIISDQFEFGGVATLNLTGEEFEVIEFFNGPVYPPYYVIIAVPWGLQNIDEFGFTYESPDGCTYEGVFEIPTCSDTENSDFQVEHIEGPDGECTIGQKHTYRISDISIGDNTPYFLEVRMKKAVHGSESGFYKKIEITDESPFNVNDVPAGIVSFNFRSRCDEQFEYKYHDNCCNEFSCEQEREYLSGENYVYEFPFVNLVAVRQCYEKCGIFSSPSEGSSNCSGVVARIGDFDPLVCWMGFINIIPPDGEPNGIMQVVPNSEGTLDVDWILPLEAWKAPSPGVHNFTIEYQGIGDSENCTQVVPVEFYGDTNSGTHVKYAVDLTTGHEHGSTGFFNNYGRSYGCPMCNNWGDNVYFFDNGCQNSSGEDVTPQISGDFFVFKPNVMYHENPCNTGGTLFYVDFNEDGVPEEKSIYISPNKSEGFHRINLPPDPNCVFTPVKGYCLFDAVHAFGQSFDKYLIAKFERLCETQIEEPIDCIDYCEDGTCVDGVCIPDEVPCDGECPPELCEDGECIEYECTFRKSIKRNGEHNGVHREWNHDMPMGATLKWTGRYGINLWFTIEGAVDFYEYCREDQSDPTRMQSEWIITNPDEKIIVNWYKEKCSYGGGANGFDMTFYCSLDGLTSGDDENSALIREDFNDYFEFVPENEEASISEFSNRLDSNSKENNVSPNPFTDAFNLNYYSEFSGVLKVNILDIYGRNIQNESRSVSKGGNVIEIKLESEVPTGVYYLAITDEKGESETFKILHVE